MTGRYLSNTSNHPDSKNTKAHDATVAKLSWAHPEFGLILASCSFDRSVKIWEQTYSDSEPQANGANASLSHWAERAVLLDAKGTVRAVEFAPHHFGLKLVRVARLIADFIDAQL